MEFSVERGYLYNNFKTVNVEEGNARISSGLLSESEARDLAEEMFDVIMNIVDTQTAKDIIKEHFHEVFETEYDLENYVDEQKESEE